MELDGVRFLRLVLLWLLFLSILRASLSGNVKSMESVPDLQKTMYMVIDGYPCVRLLNLSGEIGCSNPGREKVVAPIVRLKDADKLAQVSAILVPAEEMQNFFTRFSNDSNFFKNVGGVLIESGSQIRSRLNGFSPASKFPQAEFSPYQNVSYAWNPNGSGILWNAYYVPVFLLSESGTSTLRQVVTENAEMRKPYAADVAEFDMVMQTTKAGTHDSESCLKEGTCLPLGGYSVWSSLPPINLSTSEQSKPIILTVASMDSASFFRDKNFGADSPISGMVALLAAVDALSHVYGLDKLEKQFVFIVFTGEAWGYLGSRRFLHELELQSEFVKGLNSSLIEMVMEIGSVGKGFSQGVNSFFAHTVGNKSATNETLKALKRAQGSLNSEKIVISSASTSNPGIPPSSLMTFLKKNPQTSGIVLEDFNSVFTNKFYHSHLDDLSNVNSSSIVAAASIIARTLYILASENRTFSNSILNSINVNVSLVEELIGCLLECEPGLSCELVRSYIIPGDSCPSHYVGVLLSEPTLDPGHVSDVSRFIWNYLAERTSADKMNVSSVCSENCNKHGGVCVSTEVAGKGVCVISTTRYVPAYSTRLNLEDGTWKVLPMNLSDAMGVVDPVWTESNWVAIELRVYKVQSTFYDHLVLVGGIALTVLTYIAILVARAVVTKALKRD